MDNKGDKKKAKGSSLATNLKAKEKPKLPPQVDRAATCPFLMKVFTAYGAHNSMDDYRNRFPCDEMQIYTWLDATLLELTNLVKEVKLDCRRPGTTFDFALVYPVQGEYTYRFRNIGSTCSNFHKDADMLTLAELSFHIGDYMDIAITLPEELPRNFFYNPHFRGNEHHSNHKKEREFDNGRRCNQRSW